MTRQTIMDNVYLTYIPSEKFKTSFLSAQIMVPLTKETAALNALLVNVLNRGTADCPDMAALSARLDLLYGARLEPVVRKKGENQVFGFLASCIDDRFLPNGEKLLEPLCDLLGDLFCNPATKNGRLIGEYVDSEKANLADLIRSDINDKRLYAARRLVEEMCAGERYGISRLGTAEDVEKISLQKLNKHYKSLLPAARLELYYCGSAPEKRVAGAFRRAFAGLPRLGLVEPGPTVRVSAPEEVRLVTERMDVTQGKLCIGFRSNCDDLPAMMMFNAMFGGTSNSKLFLNVRERLSLCYYVSSSYNRKKGIMTVSSGIEFEKYQPAVDEIMAQLEALKQGQWEDWELTGARSSICNSLRAMEDSAGAMEDFFIGQLATDGEETVTGLLAAIPEVTKERICAAACSICPDTIYFLRGKEDEA